MKTKKGFRLRTLGKDNILTAEGIEVVDFNRMIALNSTAAFLWTSVEGKEFDVDTLVDLLVGEYGISVELARKDSETLINDWLEAGVVEQ